MKAIFVGPSQQDNLALGYLSAAVRAAGHHAEVVPYDERAMLDAAVGAVLEEQPDLVGVGMAFQNSIHDYLVLLRGLRERGYRGHLTCGGHVPTFCYEELLRDEPGLDTAVRHEGEETIVEMLDALARGEEPRGIAGLVWREGEGIAKGPVRAPVLDLDRLAVPERSPEPYLVGGFVVDFVITARGCVGECNYCSIAAFGAESGVPFRLRKPDAVADEIADLVHRHQTRVVFVQDDLFILPSEKKSVARLCAIRDGLARRGVPEVVFWIKGRPETLTAPVCRAAREMGAIHLFTGVENASEARLDYLGRTHLPMHNVTAIERCLEHGITPSFNFMMFDPDCSLDDIRPTLRLAERYVDLPWNVCRTEVYSGTALRARLDAERRLEGDYRSYGYRMRDERAELMFRILRVSFHERALAVTSLLNRLISLSFARQLHEHYFPGPATDRLSRTIRELNHAVRKDTLERLWAALDFATGVDPRDKQAVRRFAVDQAIATSERDLAWRAEAAGLWDTLNARGRARSAKLHMPARVRAGFRVAASS
jgi:B12 binding protein/radical SAM family protein